MIGAYKRQSLNNSCTRVEVLVKLYDRAINSIEACQVAQQANDTAGFTTNLLTLHKVIVALHSGLKADEDEVAHNVARLLHFVTILVGEAKWDEATSILNQLRASFQSITSEANQLEREGVIPPMPRSDSYESLA